MYRARTKPSWWPKWPDTVCVGVDRGTVARAWCLGDRFAVGCGLWCARDARRERWDPLGEIAAGAAVRLSLRSGAGVTPAEIRRGDPRPAPRCVVRVARPRRLHRSLSRRPSARAPFHWNQPCHRRPAVSLRRRSRAFTSAMRVPRALTAAASRARAPRPPCSSFGTGTPRRRLCVGAAIHQLRPMPDRTRSKRRRGAPRCRTSVYTDSSPKQPRGRRKCEPLDYTHGIQRSAGDRRRARR